MLRTTGLILLFLALAATAIMVVWWGAAAIGHAVWRALPSLPAALLVHGVQLTLSGVGWWIIIAPPRPAPAILIRARWVREAVNTLLPLAGLSGGVAATRLLAKQTGFGMAYATVTTTADLTCEIIAQAPYLVATLAVAALLAPGQVTPGRAALALAPVVLAASAFVIAQRAGGLRLVEHAAARVGFGNALAGLHDGMMKLHARPVQIGAAICVHFLSWSLGGAEVWVVLHAIGVPVGPWQAYAIEGVGMAARSMGFALPVGLAAQEAGFVLGASLFGIAPQDAIALSMLKRLRELLVGVSGAAVWQWSLWRR